MKQLILALLILNFSLSLDAQVSFKQLKVNPEFPKNNRPLSFEYEPASSGQPEVVVYQFSATGLKISEPAVIERAGKYSGTVNIDSNTSCIAFGFSANEVTDLNEGKGYILPVYNEKNIPVKGYYNAAANLQNGAGANLFGLPKDAAQALLIRQEGLKQYPGLKDEPSYVIGYLDNVKAAKKADSSLNASLAAFTTKKDLTEGDYATLMQYYTGIKDKATADNLSAAMKAKYPEGAWAKSEAVQPFFAAKGADKKAEIYQSFIQKYPLREKDKQMSDFFLSQIANEYATEKNYALYNEWNGKLDEATRALNNNNVAWNMAEADEKLEDAKKMADQATSFAKKEMTSPTGKRPEAFTSKQWEQQRKTNYAMYGDTYAFILYKLGDYKTAYPIAKEAATINKLKDAEYNERYAMLAEKLLPAAESKKLIEGFVTEGAASLKTKEILKNIYAKDKGSENGYDEYITGLEAKARATKLEEIAKKVINEPAPQFNLKDFDGKPVSLNDLKGKVVVVDFWATWCGPCIASMPGMNKAQLKFKDNENVKFLFIDTWESADDKLQNARDFMDKKKYPFHVLMDNDNKTVEDYKVSGIPTKFIIDKEGRIRFKAGGFSGSDDSVVDEISAMIDIASK